MPTSFDGDFYDADYFERGKESGKGWLTNYRWLPVRAHREALAYIDNLQLNEDSYVLDVGCAKGFIVQALRNLGVRADGCDISTYALSFAPQGCWNCADTFEWAEHGPYTHLVAKDVFEHLNKDQLRDFLLKLRGYAPNLMCVVPMGDKGKYRIKEYHTEISHLVAEDEIWWAQEFSRAGWEEVRDCPHVPGLKDNWQTFAKGRGNHVFILKAGT